jgi:hypothetical protein
VLASLLAFARAPVELAEAEVAVRDEGAHGARFSEREGLTIIGLAALCVEAFCVDGDVAAQVQGMGRESALRGRSFDCAVGQVSSLVEPVEQQTGAS